MFRVKMMNGNMSRYEQNTREYGKNITDELSFINIFPMAALSTVAS